VSAASLDAALVIFAVAPTLAGLAGYPALLAMDRAGAARAAELAPRVAVLEGAGMFAGASRAVLERLAAAATVQVAGAGTAIVREGDAADALYVVQTGSVDVSAVGEHGDGERALRTLPAGSYFGEIGLLERIPRTATVSAAEDCTLLCIDGDAFLDALTAAPPSATLMENARTHLARTHPSRRPTYAPTPA
jgi:NTE family protein